MIKRLVVFKRQPVSGGRKHYSPLVSKLSKGIAIEDISRDLSQELSLPIKESTDFVLDLKKRFIDSHHPKL